MSVYSGFGVNYSAAQANWAADMAFFNKIGLNTIRPVLGSLPYPWSAGTPNAGNFAYWRLCAQTFSQAGFWVTWGNGGFITAGGGGQLTTSNWLNYHDTVIAEATYDQSIGLALGDFEIGNELETRLQTTIKSITRIGTTATVTTTVGHGFLNGDSMTIVGASPSGYNGTFTITFISTTSFSYTVSSSLPSFATVTSSTTCGNLTIPQLNTNLRQLALDVKAAYNLSSISYGSSDIAGALSDWQANGIGALDTISFHPYGSINVTAQTVNLNGPITAINSLSSTLGSAAYISEFNLDGTASNVAALNPITGATAMNTLFSTIQASKLNSRSIVFSWVGNLNTTNNYAQLFMNGSINPTWFTFFSSNPEQYSVGRGTSVTRGASVARTSVVRTSYEERPRFND